MFVQYVNKNFLFLFSIIYVSQHITITCLNTTYLKHKIL